MRKTISIYIEITNGYIGTISKKLEIASTKREDKYFFKYSNKVNDNIILKGLDYIRKDFDQNYSELLHYMYFSKNRGFESDDSVHFSDTFQRAMLNDCLLDVMNKYNCFDQEYLDKECEYLLSRVNQDEIGGWSYFPTVSEIAADIDDLGQIIQFFLKSKRKDLVEKYAIIPIQIVLENRINLNGGIETWIIPKNNKTTLQKRQTHFNGLWGNGPHLEVVANFIYALHEYNSVVYEKYIKNALRYIINEQKEDGYWESRWYYGNYYGIFTCLRILIKYKEKHQENISFALNYLLETQKIDGGYGLNTESNSDALNTALALLSMKMLLDKEHETIQKATHYLLNTQNEKGYWEDIEFIKPRQQEPYSSKTLTTAFVIKSLCYEY